MIQWVLTQYQTSISLLCSGTLFHKSYILTCLLLQFQTYLLQAKEGTSTPKLAHFEAALIKENQVPESMSTKFVGKHVLLNASDLDHWRIPEGEEDFLFQYHIDAVNSNYKNSTIECNGRCIENDSHYFQRYPKAIGSDITILITALLISRLVMNVLMIILGLVIKLLMMKKRLNKWRQ